MVDRPIIFSAPMVRALLDGRKTQTRRILKPQPPADVTSAGVIARSGEGQTDEWTWLTGDPADCDTWETRDDFKTRFVPGDRLWVRETHFQWGMWDYQPDTDRKWRFHADRSVRDGWFMYEDDQADGYVPPKRVPGRIAWYRRPAIFMPREVSRLTLIVEAVKVERLTAISEADAMAEGIEKSTSTMLPTYHVHDIESRTARGAFFGLWDSIHGPDAWAKDPWVVAVSFRVVKANIGSVHYTSAETLRAVLDPTTGSEPLLSAAAAKMSR